MIPQLSMIPIHDLAGNGWSTCDGVIADVDLGTSIVPMYFFLTATGGAGGDIPLCKTSSWPVTPEMTK